MHGFQKGTAIAGTLPMQFPDIGDYGKQGIYRMQLCLLRIETPPLGMQVTAYRNAESFRLTWNLGR